MLRKLFILGLSIWIPPRMSTFGFLNKKNKTVYSLITIILSYYKCTFHEDKLRRKKKERKLYQRKRWVYSFAYSNL